MRAVFSLAAAAPSNSNTQPWHVEVVSGDSWNRLSEALLEAHGREALSTDFPYSDDLYTGAYAERRRAAGGAMYGALGIAREDARAMRAYDAESLTFYGAPHVALLFLPSNAEARMASGTRRVLCGGRRVLLPTRGNVTPVIPVCLLGNSTCRSCRFPGTVVS